ncbi:MAG TPA: ribbon-helix-helix domain-containing protein [Candidatus Nanoarchaeia archaeon]|nr:ribbon-helix-helix domain-containing protein [Candidatus Nanoarchaeia archaeon]
MKDTLHIRISEELKEKVEALVDSGLFSNTNEVVRQAIRGQILKYKNERKGRDDGQ